MMQMAVIISQLTALPTAFTKTFPAVTKNWYKIPRAPLIVGSEISDMYMGAAREKEPPPKPVLEK